MSRPARSPDDRPRSLRAVFVAVASGLFVVGPALLPGGSVPFASVPFTSVPFASVPAARAATPCDPEKQVLIPERPPALDRLGTAELSRRGTGQGVTVAVVDSGVTPDNVHLRDALAPGTSLLPGDTDPRGTTDVTSHGTAVAGLVAARPVDGSGLVGVAPDARILPVRVYASEEQEDVAAGRGPEAGRIAAGLRYAADAGARVALVPLGLPEPDGELEEAVGYATARGTLVVASAGNREEAPDRPDGPRYPAAVPGALGVGAITSEDRPAESSVTGNHVDVVAPGTDVLATYFGAGDCLLESDVAVTAWSAAYVAGVAAVVAQAHPDASAEELAYRLQVTADRPVRSARDDVRGWGIVSPVEAVDAPLDATRAGPPLPGAPATPPPIGAPRAADIQPLTDPAAEEKSAAGWWLLGGAGVLGLAALTSAATSVRSRPSSDATRPDAATSGPDDEPVDETGAGSGVGEPRPGRRETGVQG